MGGSGIVHDLQERGPKNDPFNYRGIALINHLTKLFTAVLLNRFSEWTVSNSIILKSNVAFEEEEGAWTMFFVELIN